MTVTEEKTPKKRPRRRRTKSEPEEGPDYVSADQLHIFPGLRPPLTHARTETGRAVGYWPEYVEPPRRHRRATVHPCQRCKAHTLEGGQAVVIRGCSGGLAYMRCKACGHEWSIPLED